jgi:hypothetical protein
VIEGKRSTSLRSTRSAASSRFAPVASSAKSMWAATITSLGPSIMVSSSTTFSISGRASISALTSSSILAGAAWPISREALTQMRWSATQSSSRPISIEATPSQRVEPVSW